jgi:hypothetical protein
MAGKFAAFDSAPTDEDKLAKPASKFAAFDSTPAKQFPWETEQAEQGDNSYNESVAALRRESDALKAQGEGDKVAQGGLAGLVTGQRQPQRDVSGAESATRGGYQGATLGFGDEAAALVETGISKVPGLRDFAQLIQPAEHLDVRNPDYTYAQRRDAKRQANTEAQQANPKTYTLSEFAGALAAPVPGGSLVKGAGLGAKAANGAIQGAITGAAAGLGNSEADLTKGQFGQAAIDTAKGAAAGTVAGAALPVVGKAVGKVASKAGEKLQEKYVQTFGSEVLGLSRPRDKAAWGAILGKSAEEGVEANAAKKYVRSVDLQPVEKAAAKGNYDEALGHVDAKLAKLRPGREANYAKLDEAAQFQVGKGLDEIDRARFAAVNGAKKNPQVAQALQHAKDRWVHDYSTADAGAVQRTLLRPEGTDVTTQIADELRAVVDALPQQGPITRTAISEAINATGASPDALRYVESRVLDPARGLMSWNPTATIPAVELRGAASQAQQAANQALGMFNQTLHHETKTAVQNAVVKALENHLDAVAKAEPKLKSIVDNIRQDDVKFSVLLAAKTGLNQAVQKTNTNELSPLKALGKIAHGPTTPLLSVPLGAQAASEVPHDIEQGNYGRAALHGSEALGLFLLGGQAIYRGAARKYTQASNRASAIKPIFDSKVGRMGTAVINAIKAGVPRAAAMEAARLAASGMSFDDVSNTLRRP